MMELSVKHGLPYSDYDQMIIHPLVHPFGLSIHLKNNCPFLNSAKITICKFIFVLNIQNVNNASMLCLKHTAVPDNKVP